MLAPMSHMPERRRNWRAVLGFPRGISTAVQPHDREEIRQLVILDPDRARRARTKSSWRPPENGVDRRIVLLRIEKGAAGEGERAGSLIPLVTRIPRRLQSRSLMEGTSVRRVSLLTDGPYQLTSENSRLRPRIPALPRSLCSRSRKPFASLHHPHLVRYHHRDHCPKRDS